MPLRKHRILPQNGTGLNITTNISPVRRWLIRLHMALPEKVWTKLNEPGTMTLCSECVDIAKLELYKDRIKHKGIPKNEDSKWALTYNEAHKQHKAKK